MERVEVRIRLQEAFLKNILGILIVLSNVFSQRIDLALVLPDKLSECARIARPRALHKRKFFVLFQRHHSIIRCRAQSAVIR